MRPIALGATPFIKPPPVAGVSDFWFAAGGRTGAHDTPNIKHVRQQVKEMVREMMREASWVSDGFHSHIQSEIAEQADVVIFLDIPLWRRMVNHAARTIHRRNRHAFTTPWRDMRFFAEMLRHDLHGKRRKILKFLKPFQSKLIILRSREDIRRYLQTLECGDISD